MDPSFFKRLIKFFSRRDKEMKEYQTADNFLFRQLESMGCMPRKEEEAILFRYFGAYMYATNLHKDTIRITFPGILSVENKDQNLLCRLMNGINSSFSLLKVVAGPSPIDTDVYAHIVADFYYTSANASEEKLMDLLSAMMDAQRMLTARFSYADMNHKEEENDELEGFNSSMGDKLN